MRFLAITALLFASCVAVLLTMSYRMAAGYRPHRENIATLHVEGPVPGTGRTLSAGAVGPGSHGSWIPLPLLLLACVLSQAVALVLLSVERAFLVQIGVTSLALVLWAVAWWLDRLTLSAVAALTLAGVLAWQLARALHRHRNTRRVASTGQKNQP